MQAVFSHLFMTVKMTLCALIVLSCGFKASPSPAIPSQAIMGNHDRFDDEIKERRAAKAAASPTANPTGNPTVNPTTTPTPSTLKGN